MEVEEIEAPRRQLTHVDLCAGTGTFSLAAQRLGMRTIYANDMSTASKVAYDANITSCRLDCCRLESVPLDAVPEADVYTVSTPCTPWSVAGVQSGTAHPEWPVFEHIMKVLRHRQPRWVVSENVTKILSKVPGSREYELRTEVMEVVRKYLPEYKLKLKVYNTRIHSRVPQDRRRVYMVWLRDAADYQRFDFPNPRPTSTLLVSALLQPESEVDDKYYYANRQSKSWFQQHMRTAQLEPVRSTQSVYTRWHKTVKQSKGHIGTICARMTMSSNSLPVVRDDRGNRMLTPRECMRAQGLPDSYVLPEELTDNQCYHLAGNAVSLPIAELVLGAVLDSRYSVRHDPAEQHCS